ncbi:hypothetical protein FOL47_010080 [Perkinsus chesapeaki]|uniref:Uncharacterized protein n=1 Tax=Perkinsus chesapeaki TaxID=330153 RepID=A0A7J6L4Y6_PERCH|nr:hypothetical protein FOL47_010080 [Perkinsus chesapeaki]
MVRRPRSGVLPEHLLQAKSKDVCIPPSPIKVDEIRKKARDQLQDRFRPVWEAMRERSRETLINKASKTSPKQLNVGDYAWIFKKKSHKLDLPWRGPYKIEDINGIKVTLRVDENHTIVDSYDNILKVEKPLKLTSTRKGLPYGTVVLFDNAELGLVIQSNGTDTLLQMLKVVPHYSTAYYVQKLYWDPKNGKIMGIPISGSDFNRTKISVGCVSEDPLQDENGDKLVPLLRSHCFLPKRGHPQQDRDDKYCILNVRSDGYLTRRSVNILNNWIEKRELSACVLEVEEQQELQEDQVKVTPPLTRDCCYIESYIRTSIEPIVPKSSLRAPYECMIRRDEENCQKSMLPSRWVVLSIALMQTSYSSHQAEDENGGTSNATIILTSEQPDKNEVIKLWEECVKFTTENKHLSVIDHYSLLNEWEGFTDNIKEYFDFKDEVDVTEYFWEHEKVIPKCVALLRKNGLNGQYMDTTSTTRRYEALSPIIEPAIVMATIGLVVCYGMTPFDALSKLNECCDFIASGHCMCSPPYVYADGEGHQWVSAWVGSYYNDHGTSDEHYDNVKTLINYGHSGCFFGILQSIVEGCRMVYELDLNNMRESEWVLNANNKLVLSRGFHKVWCGGPPLVVVSV